MGTPIDRTAKNALDKNLVNGVTSDAPTMKANNDTIYNYVDSLNGSIDSALAGIYSTDKVAQLGVINVKDPQFAAKGDGVTDDTVAIQRALNTATTTKAKVVFPPGTYIVNTLLVASGLVIEGIGDVTIKQATSRAFATPDKLTFINITLDEAGYKSYRNPVNYDTSPALIRSHFGLLRGQWFLDAEAGGTISYTVSSAAAAGANTINLTSTAGLLVDQLISYLGTDGEYYSARINTVNPTNITIRGVLEQGIATGANVWNYYINYGHPNVYGYRALADYALRSLHNESLKERRVVASFRNMYTRQAAFVTVIGSATLATNSSSNAAIPGSPLMSTLQVNCVAENDGIITKSVKLAGRAYKYKMLLNAGTTGTMTVSVKTKSGLYIASKSFNTQGSQVITVEDYFKARQDDEVSIEIKQSGIVSFFQVGYIDIIELSDDKDDLNNGTHVLLGDSWFAQEGVYERLTERLPNALIVNKGLGGNKVSDLISRFDSDVKLHKPHYVWVISGTNDYFARVDAPTFAAQMDILISKIMAIGAKPIMFEPSVGVRTYPGYSDLELTDLSRNYLFYTDYLLKDDAASTLTTQYFDVNTDFNALAAGASTNVACLGVFPTGTKIEIDNFGGINLTSSLYLEIGFASGIITPFDQSMKVTTIGNGKGTTSVTSTGSRFIVVKKVNGSGASDTFGSFVRLKVTLP